MAPRGNPPAHPGPGERLRLVAVACRRDAIQARRPGGSRALFVRPEGRGSRPPLARLPVEGECFELQVTSSWSRGPERWLAGELAEVGLDLEALGLEPLALVETGPWDAGRDQLQAPPPVAGARTEYELELVPAGRERAAAESALHRSIERWADDRPGAARAVLGELLRRDLRCLAAHACLGFFAFNSPPESGGPARAERHYGVGLAIARLSIRLDFPGVLPWSRPGNRPFLRCLYGHSICLWRRGELRRARAGFTRLCRLNPADQLAARLALDRIERGGG